MSLDIKGLEDLFKLCRKQGVLEFSQGDLSVKFGDVPDKKSKKQEFQVLEEDAILEDPYVDFPDEILTEEQLSYYSNGGSVGQEPWKAKK